MMAAVTTVGHRAATESTPTRARSSTTPVKKVSTANATELPTIATVRRAVVNRDLALPTPLEAWQAASTRNAELHPLVKEVVNLFGGRFTIIGSHEPTIMRAQFLKAYSERRDEELRRANVSRYRNTA